MVLFLSGALSLVLGVLAFRHFGQGSTALLPAIWTGVVMLFEGVGEAVTAINQPVRRGRAWDIFLGIVTAIAGVVALASSLRSIRALTLIVGIWLVLVAISQIVAAFGVRKVGKRHSSTQS
jgi:uncharacterized membrane protein HdeD (DUF308 family)